MAKAKPRAYPLEPVTIPSLLVRAAQACAGNNDFRRMLNGVCIRPDGYIESSNGYTAFRGAAKTLNIEPIPMQQVLMIHGKIPTSRATCQFEWHDANGGTVRCIDTLKGVKADVLAAFEVLHEVRDVDELADEIFPNLDPIFKHQPLEAITHIGMTSTVLATVGRVFGSWASCSINFRGPTSSVVVTPLAEVWCEYEAALLLMPTSEVTEDSSEPVATFALESGELDGWSFAENPEDEKPPESDPLLDQVIELVKESRKISISYIQRKMKVGYNRAARIVEQLEADGVVSPVLASGTREVLI